MTDHYFDPAAKLIILKKSGTVVELQKFEEDQKEDLRKFWSEFWSEFWECLPYFLEKVSYYIIIITVPIVFCMLFFNIVCSILR